MKKYVRQQAKRDELGNAIYSHLFSLLAVTMVTPLPAPAEGFFTNMRFGIQIGLPILSSVLVLAARILSQRPGVSPKSIKILIVFFVAFIMAWSPFDFWKYLPTTLWAIQFPYRILMFVVFFGTLLSAIVLQFAFPTGISESKFVGCVALIVVFACPYVQTIGPAMPLHYIDKIHREPSMAGGGAEGIYLIKEAKLPKTTSAHSKLEIPANKMSYGKFSVCRVELAADTLVILPILYYPGVLRVLINGVDSEYTNSGKYVAVEIPRGTAEIAETWVGSKIGNYASLMGWGLAVLILIVESIFSLAKRITLTMDYRRLIFLKSGAYAILFFSLYGFALYTKREFTSTSKPHSVNVRVTATSDNEIDPKTRGANNLFVENSNEAWVAMSDRDTTLLLKLEHPATVEGFALYPRLTSFYECWTSLQIQGFLNGVEVLTTTADFSNEYDQPTQEVRFGGVNIDSLKITFSNPNHKDLNGHPVVGELHPGYTKLYLK